MILSQRPAQTQTSTGLIPQADAPTPNLVNPVKESAPADDVSIEDTNKKSTADKVVGVGKALSKAVSDGLSYANARRARQDAS